MPVAQLKRPEKIVSVETAPEFAAEVAPLKRLVAEREQREREYLAVQASPPAEEDLNESTPSLRHARLAKQLADFDGRLDEANDRLVNAGDAEKAHRKRIQAIGETIARQNCASIAPAVNARLGRIGDQLSALRTELVAYRNDLEALRQVNACTGLFDSSRISMAPCQVVPVGPLLRHVDSLLARIAERRK
jgi:hypothetical protein